MITQSDISNTCPKCKKNTFQHPSIGFWGSHWHYQCTTCQYEVYVGITGTLEKLLMLQKNTDKI